MVRRDKHNIERFYGSAVPLDRFSSGELRVLAGRLDHWHIRIVIALFGHQLVGLAAERNDFRFRIEATETGHAIAKTGRRN